MGHVPPELHCCHGLLLPHGVAVEEGSPTVLWTLVHFATMPELIGPLPGSWRSPTLGTPVCSSSGSLLNTQNRMASHLPT